MHRFFFQHCRSNSNEMWPRLPSRIDGEGREGLSAAVAEMTL